MPRYLIESVLARGIELRFGHSLASIVQEGDFVTAVFENGQSVKGIFVVGCDGLHSKTRVALFGNEIAEYTGLTQVRFSFPPIEYFLNLHVKATDGRNDSNTSKDSTLTEYLC